MDIKNAYALAERMFAEHAEPPLHDTQEYHGTVARLTHLLLTEPHEDGAAAIAVMGMKGEKGLEIAKTLVGYIRIFSTCERAKAAVVLDRFRLAITGGPRITTVPELQARSKAFIETVERVSQDRVLTRQIVRAIKSRFN